MEAETKERTTFSLDEYKRYVEFDKKKKELEAELSNIKKKMAKMEEQLIDGLIDNEMHKVSIAGKTCYVHNMTYASVKDKQKAMEVLKQNGFEDYISEGINNNSISALIRHLQSEEGEGIPESFRGVIDPFEKISLRVVADS